MSFYRGKDSGLLRFVISLLKKVLHDKKEDAYHSRRSGWKQGDDDGVREMEWKGNDPYQEKKGRHYD